MTHELADPAAGQDPPDPASETLFDLVDAELAELGDDDIDARLRHTLRCLGVDGPSARRPGVAGEWLRSARRRWAATDAFCAPSATGDWEEETVARLAGLEPARPGPADRQRLLDDAHARQLILEAALEAHRIRVAAKAEAEEIRQRAYQDAWRIRHAARPRQQRRTDAVATMTSTPENRRG